MASITWYDNGTGDGSGASSGLDIYMYGSTIPSNAVFTQVTCAQAISSSTYSSSKQNCLYYLLRSDGSAIFSGSPIATSSMGSESGSPTSANNFHSHCTVYYTMYNSSAQSGYNYLRGYSGAWFTVKINNNNGSSKSYWRAGKLTFTYYIRCGDPSNVVATGGQRQLSATWTRGANGTDDTANHWVCYNTSKTWNTNTQTSTSGSSASWTINTAGTYYVGVKVIGSASGEHSVVWSNAAQVTTFSPTLVTKGQLIKATDYNQIRNVYSGLTAMTAGSSKVDDANITAVRNYTTNVVAATAGGTVTADYFNNSVLNRIT